MNHKLQNKILSITHKLKGIPIGKNRHFSFLVERNQIVSIGWNNSWKTHPLAKIFGYRFDSIHSELAAYIRYQGKHKSLRNCVLINTRINRFGEIGVSKPCEKCLKWLPQLSLKAIYFTNNTGQFEELISSDDIVMRRILSFI